MLIKPFFTPSGKKIFDVKLGQFALGLAMLIVIGILIVLSFSSYQNQNATRETVLAEESDSSALVFTQKESFNLVLQLNRYLLGETTIETVWVARETLAQQLESVASNGDTSLEIAGEDYRQALRELDDLLLQEDWVLKSAELDASAAGFINQARLLSDAFQELSRKNIQRAVQERALVDLIQGLLAILALALGFALFVWVVRDLASGFRVGYRELAEQSAAISKAQQDFISIQALEERVARWNQNIAKGADPVGIEREVRTELQSLSETGKLKLTSSRGLEVDLGEGLDPEATETRRLLEGRLSQLIAHLRREQESNQLLEWEREHDALTGLQNRRGISRELNAKLQSTNQDEFLLIDVDLDGFTGFNNSMGQAAGDRLLIEVASRLETLNIRGKVSSRIAADEFVLIAPLNNQSASQILEQVEGAVRYESNLLPDSFQVSSCIGWHQVRPNETADEASAKAGAALKAAKAVGKTGITQNFEDAEHGHLLTDYLEQVTFRNAMLGGEVTPFLQPIVNLKTRELEGYEALARWKSNDRGVVTPDIFMPLVNQGGMLDELFQTVLEYAAKNWSRLPKVQEGPYLSVNVDPKTLQVLDFADWVIGVLLRTKFDPKLLVLEITEQSLIDKSRIAELEKLRALGVRIALDDFGTGYSSLSQLASLPIDILKVDRGFIVDGLEGASGEMLRTIRQMATSARLKVVVEGVETEATAVTLSQFGFENGQGYLFGKAEDLLSIQ